jgi:hypothetical protein
MGCAKPGAFFFCRSLLRQYSAEKAAEKVGPAAFFFGPLPINNKGMKKALGRLDTAGKPSQTKILKK